MGYEFDPLEGQTPRIDNTLSHTTLAHAHSYVGTYYSSISQVSPNAQQRQNIRKRIRTYFTSTYYFRFHHWFTQGFLPRPRGGHGYYSTRYTTPIYVVQQCILDKEMAMKKRRLTEVHDAGGWVGGWVVGGSVGRG